MNKDTIKYLKALLLKINNSNVVKTAVIVIIVVILLFLIAAGSADRRDPRQERDAKRISGIRQLQDALNLYAEECGGYPSVATFTEIGSPDFDTSFRQGCPEGKNFGTFNYWENERGFTKPLPLPTNPEPGGEPYAYCSTDVGSLICTSSGKSYAISFSLEKGAVILSAGKHFATPEGIQ